MTEAEFLDRLRALPLHPGALDLRDDAARLDAGALVVTTDTLVEGVHFLATDPPGDVAWKLLATNLSDLAAKGAVVEGVLLNYPLGDDAWDGAFLAGFGDALETLGARLLGGDTIALPRAASRALTLTAFGTAAAAPPRSGAHGSDALWVTGTIGDGGAGLTIAKRLVVDPAGIAVADGPAALLAAYRRPRPLLAEGRALAPLVTAMMDVSDGLLLDAARMAAASGLGVAVDLAAVPLSAAYRDHAGGDRAARLAAATAGDDYQLLFAGPANAHWPVPATAVGRFVAAPGLALHDAGTPLPLPPSLGWEHRG